MSIITLNAGSSSMKFSVYDRTGTAERLRGALDGVGEDARLTVSRHGGEAKTHDLPTRKSGHGGAVEAALELAADETGETVHAIGHRIVHGGADFESAAVLDEAVMARLRDLTPMAPLHQPHNLDGVEAARRAFPDALQVGVFDTAFHRGHPFENDVFALPRRYYEAGVRRYGFHGLSYEYLSARLAALEPAAERAVIAHLGSGASLCAISDGRSVGSTMGFSALDGLPMATRCGQLDPGVMLYLMREDGLDADALQDLLYKESGLKGLSGVSGDMRALEASDAPEARQAIDYFVVRCRRELAAMTALLGGLDAVVFSGGVGENSTLIRERIMAGFDYLGLTPDSGANAHATGDAARISAPGSRVSAWMIRTDEESVIARDAARCLAER